VSASRKVSDKPLTPRHAWQPFTPRGIAAFGQATNARLIIVELIVALLVVGAVVSFLRGVWFPVITEAIEKLPQTGAIRRGELSFAGESPMRLAENSRLAIVVDIERTGDAGRVADVEVTFEKNRMAICGALGCWWQPYDSGYVISFNRPEVKPAWGAWQWPVIALAILGTVASLFVMWWSVALVYVPVTKLIAFFSDRVIAWSGAWRLNAAALLPGACLVAAALVLYGFGAINLFQFALLFVLHAVAGLIFLSTSPFFLPKVQTDSRGKNPFVGEGKDPLENSAPGQPNPFSRKGGP
jgi:hypothetical protein